MDKKEALQNIIYNLKEIEGTRLRLSTSKTEIIDIELALLNQQVINLYRHLQNYQSGMYVSSPPDIPIKKEEPIVYKPIQEAPKPTPKEPQPPVTNTASEQESELKRVKTDAASRKERLKRLEAEAEKIEAERNSAKIEPAPKGELEDFAQIVEEKEEAKEIAIEMAKISGESLSAHGNLPKTPSAERTLNEKLQSSTKVPESLNEKFAQGEVKKTLADKMKLSPIGDLKSAMALNQKIAYTNELFGGDDKEFKKALAFLNNCTNFSEAKFYMQSEIAKRYAWDDDSPLVEEFTELVYRKFL